MMDLFEFKLKQVAKAFYRDGKDDPEYPHKSAEEQEMEFRQLIGNGGMSREFIGQTYDDDKEFYASL